MWSRKAENYDLHTCAALSTAEGRAKRARQAWCARLSLVGSVDRGFWAISYARSRGLDDAPWPRRALTIHSFPALHLRLDALGGDPGV